MTRSRGPMPPPPPPSGRRSSAEQGAVGQGGRPAEPTWAAVPHPAPAAGAHRPAAPDPRYPPQGAVDPEHYRYPDHQRGHDQQRGYEAPPAPRAPTPTLSEVAASMRAGSPRPEEPVSYPHAETSYHSPALEPQHQRYGHQGHASYAAPSTARSQRPSPAAPPALPPMPVAHPRPDDLRGAQYDDRQRRNDQSSYDLGNYGIPARAQPEHGYPPATYDPREAAGWQAPPRSEDPDVEPYLQRQDPRQGGRGAADQAYDEHGQEYGDEEYEEEPRRGGRRWLVVAALVGSIGLGGGLAYVYKTYFTDKSGGRPPIVKASQQPAKSAPESPGGKQFANQDSRILSRLEQDSGASRGVDVDANGVRRVPTIQVGRDGSIGAPPAAPAVPARSSVQVPGMIIDGFSSGGGAVPPAPPASPFPAERVAVPPPPPPPAATVRNAMPAAPPAPPIARNTPPPAANSTVAARTPPAPAVSLSGGEAPDAAAPKRPVPKATEAARKSGSSGYVAVLTTRGSRMDALRSFADMQQKYPVLQDKVPDVIEADLTSRNLGKMYRLVVGPPGPRGQVSALCSQLKTAGYNDCWATQY